MHAAVLSAGLPGMTFNDPRETHDIFAGALALLRGGSNAAAASTPETDSSSESVTFKVASALRKVLKPRPRQTAQSVSESEGDVDSDTSSKNASSDETDADSSSGSDSDSDSDIDRHSDAYSDQSETLFSDIHSMIADIEFELFSPLPKPEDDQAQDDGADTDPSQVIEEIFDADAEEGASQRVSSIPEELRSTPGANWL